MIINRLTPRKVNAYAFILVSILVRAFIYKLHKLSQKLELIRIRTFSNNRRKNIHRDLYTLGILKNSAAKLLEYIAYMDSKNVI